MKKELKDEKIEEQKILTTLKRLQKKGQNILWTINGFETTNLSPQCGPIYGFSPNQKYVNINTQWCMVKYVKILDIFPGSKK